VPMANPQAVGEDRRVRRRRRSHSELEDEKLYKSGGKETVTLEPDAEEVRRIRIERLEGSATNGRPAATPKMTSESHATLPSSKSASSHRKRRDHHRRPEEKKHRRRWKSSAKDDITSEYVYGPPGEKSQSSRITVSETRRLGRDEESSESEEDVAVQPEPVKEPRKRRIKIVYITEEEAKAARRRERRERRAKELSDQELAEPVHRSRVHHSRRRSSAAETPPASPPKRYVPEIPAGT
jgi:hypothetical protein